jgi:hypothetical protein
MARLKKIYVIHTTSTVKNANTDEEGFHLIATTSGADFRARFKGAPHTKELREKSYLFEL